MAVTQYIGSRYVPIFADPIEWSASNTYEPLTIVIHEGNSYTSKQAVPKGVDISNEAFWALTGNYNAQVEQYRRETAQYREDTLELATRTDEIEASITEILKHTSDVYNVREYGAKGDGVTDDYQAIQDVLTSVYNNGGGIVYIPSGVYKIATQLVIGSNTVLTGDGVTSVLYGNGANITYTGDLVGVSGSNIVIEKINAKYDTNVFIEPGANMGFIGISQIDFNSGVEYANRRIESAELVYETHRNIIVRDIITDCSYVVQTENAPAAGTNYILEDIIYKDIIAPNGCVSWQLNGYNAINRIYVDNVSCAYLRGKYGRYCEAYISNSYANVAMLNSGPNYISNCVFDFTPDNVVREWIATGNFNVNAILEVHKHHLSNVFVNGHSDNLGLTGILSHPNVLYAGLSESPTLANVRVTGISSGKVCDIQPGNTFNYIPLMSNCVFSEGNTTTTPSVFSAMGTNVYPPAQAESYLEHPLLVSNKTVYGLATLEEGVSSAPASAFAYACNNTLYMAGTLTFDTPYATGVKICTLNSLYHNTTATLHGIAVGLTADNVAVPCRLNVNPNNGDVTATVLSSAPGIRLTRMAVNASMPIRVL